MHFTFPHATTKAAAIRKIQDALQHARKEIGAHAMIDREEWQDDVLHFGATVQGKSITGTLAVSDTEFVVDAKLPLLWRIFEGRTEKMIAAEVAKLAQQGG